MAHTAAQLQVGATVDATWRNKDGEFVGIYRGIIERINGNGTYCVRFHRPSPTSVWDDGDVQDVAGTEIYNPRWELAGSGGGCCGWLGAARPSSVCSSALGSSGTAVSHCQDSGWSSSTGPMGLFCTPTPPSPCPAAAVHGCAARWMHGPAHPTPEAWDADGGASSARQSFRSSMRSSARDCHSPPGDVGSKCPNCGAHIPTDGARPAGGRRSRNRQQKEPEEQTEPKKLVKSASHHEQSVRTVIAELQAGLPALAAQLSVSTEHTDDGLPYFVVRTRSKVPTDLRKLIQNAWNRRYRVDCVDGERWCWSSDDDKGPASGTH